MCHQNYFKLSGTFYTGVILILYRANIRFYVPPRGNLNFSLITVFLAVTLTTNQSSDVVTNRSPPGVHPRVAGERAAPPPADHAHQRVAALLRDHEGAARVTLARVLARVSSADVHA